MAIFVVCPGCKKRFTVSDKFAGQQGPCPSCKTIIRIPKPEEQVKIHAPGEFADGGRGLDGKLVLKPIERKHARLTTTQWILIGAGVVLVPALAFLGGMAGLFEGMIGRLVGLLLVSPLLTLAGHAFLKHQDDLEPLSGTALYVRAAICAVAYVALWLAFEWVAGQFITEELWTWFVAVPFFFIGAFVGLGAMDLEYGSGFAHFTFFALVIVILRGLAGVGWIWEIGRDVLPLM